MILEDGWWKSHDSVFDKEVNANWIPKNHVGKCNWNPMISKKEEIEKSQRFALPTTRDEFTVYAGMDMLPKSIHEDLRQDDETRNMTRSFMEKQEAKRQQEKQRKHQMHQMKQMQEMQQMQFMEQVQFVNPYFVNSHVPLYYVNMDQYSNWIHITGLPENSNRGNRARNRRQQMLIYFFHRHCVPCVQKQRKHRHGHSSEHRKTHRKRAV